MTTFRIKDAALVPEELKVKRYPNATEPQYWHLSYPIMLPDEAKIRAALEEKCECRMLQYADMLKRGLEPVPYFDEPMSYETVAEIARSVYARTICVCHGSGLRQIKGVQRIEESAKCKTSR